VVRTLESQLATYESVKDQIVASADASIEAAKNKVVAMEQKLAEQKAALAQIEQDFERQKRLYEENIISTLKFQEAERKYLEQKAKVEQATADLAGARADLTAKERDRDAKRDKAQADIEYARSLLEKAGGDVAKSESEIAKAQSDLQTAQADVLDTESKVARQQMQTIRSPMDGIVTQITPNLGSQMLKEGDPICVIVPETEDRAVQIWLDGNDATLVEPGRHVRLQFEGWPAVQFAGWPSVAVGTFGGKIVSVDATDNGKGQFRALVRPDESDQPWPAQRYLRQGVRANGWVLLDQVPLWFEIWRQMNGFPPVIDGAGPNPDSKVTKAPKLPKA
jgi:multidrug resistance efflux pump